MRIGVNALFLIPGKVGGTEIYLRNLLAALSVRDGLNEYFIYRNRETGADLTPAKANFRDRPQRIAASNRPARILYEQLALPRAAMRDRVDVLFNAGFTVPLAFARPMVTVFHDLQYIHHPELFRRWDLPFWRILLPASARRSSRIVTLSGAVRDDLVRHYRYPAARVDVIPHAIEPEFARIALERRLNPPAHREILTVSTLHPHKNLNRLLEAFRAFLDRQPDWKLIIVGLKGFDAAKIEAAVRTLRLEDSVEITGWIERERVYRFFRRATAFVYPSRFEGFGIPVLEALTAGIPVACSSIPSLREIADDAACFFEPTSAGSIATALSAVSLEGRVREALTLAGPSRAAHFSAAQSATRLIEVFGQAARRSK